MTETLVHSIFVGLFFSESYTRKVLPFLKSEYFETKEDKIIYEHVYDFFLKYNALPTKEAIIIAIDKSSLDEDLFTSVTEKISNVEEAEFNEQWLLDETEKFCQERAIYNALMESISIAQGESKNQTPENIPEILKKALGVSFDTNIGHDFIENAADRFEFYHRKEEKLEFDLSYMNKITQGGVPKKTLNIIFGGTGAGKTAIMCHFAASHYSQNKNVLYISMEMSEEEISKRIDANLLNVPLQDIVDIPKPSYEKKIELLRSKSKGKLIVREYPTAAAHVGHFRHLLHELELKKNFRPDIIFIDYLNICASSRIKTNASANMYSYVKSIAEEIRGLAVEYNVPIWTGTQLNRDGIGNSDPDITNTSESMGLSHTADLIIAAIVIEELEKQGKILFKQLKNRYNDVNKFNKFVVGIDRSRMKLYDANDEMNVEESHTDKEERKSNFSVSKDQKSQKPKFDGFKI